LNRRELLIGSAVGAAGAALPMLAAGAAWAAGGMGDELEQQLRVCTPSDPLGRLLEGNTRFARAWAAAADEPSPQRRMQTLEALWENNCQIDPQALAQGQKPFAALLSCADSRVDPGWLFACGSGELFQVRSAGNTAGDDTIASLEYAVDVLEVPLILVMGHSGCGAVQAAMADAPLTPLLEQLVTPIRASLGSQADLSQADLSQADLSQAVKSHARCACRQLTARSQLLRDAAAAGTVKIRASYFDISSGRVTLL
jgi:carbonic anhydrase